MRTDWTVLELLRWTTGYLEGRGVTSPRSEAEMLLCHTLGLDRLGLYLHHDRPLCPEELARFKPLLLKRAKGFPLQYILGKTEFFGVTLRIHPPVFIPRPETEVLVEAVLERLKDEGSPLIADVGTGSGNIAIALAKNLEEARIFATEISPAALLLARENAQANGVSSRIYFLSGDLLLPLRDLEIPGGLDAVVSNPPYIPTGDLPDLPQEVKHEDRRALDGGEDGTRFHRRLAAESREFLRPGGLLAMEVGDGQAERVAEILEGYGWEKVETLEDLSGTERVVLARA